MEAKIKSLILTLNSEIDELKRALEGMNDNDYVGINTCLSLIGEKKITIERLSNL